MEQLEVLTTQLTAPHFNIV